MTLLQDIEGIREDIAGVLRVGADEIPLSQKELLFFGMLRLLLNGVEGSGSGSIIKVYRPMIERVTGTWTLTTAQSMTVYNKGNTNGSLTVDGNVFVIEPGEGHSWTPPGENVLSAMEFNGTGTILVINYLEKVA